MRTQVAIVGAGPAGLFLSHLLGAAQIESVVLDARTQEEIETTVRAGILEANTLEALTRSGASTRVLVDGMRHDGIELRIDGDAHRIDFAELVQRSVWLYPQHEVLRDLLATRLAAGQPIAFATRVTGVEGIDSDRPEVTATDAEGRPVRVQADYVVGADGSHSVVRRAVGGSSGEDFFREYPFAWFGILADAPPSAPELIYSNSADGFALISQRSATVQRMYLQCDPDLDPDSVSDAEIWEMLEARTRPLELARGPILQRDVLRFRSFVAARLQRGRITLAGDSAHTVPPTGAKGMNLAIADVIVLARLLTRAVREGRPELLGSYGEAVLPRIWKAQHFSWWMTSLLHRQADAAPFDHQRQRGELASIFGSRAAQTYLAEGYTGWPLDLSDLGPVPAPARRPAEAIHG